MKLYRTIYADPPWCFRDKLDPTRRKPYPEMTTEEIKKLPIKKLVADKAHLYLWCVHTHLKEGLEVMESWGFQYKTLIVWRKLTKHGKLWFGMGHYFRASVEICLFGVKGNLPTRTKNTRNIFDAIRPNLHSAKPEKMYEIIEANSYPPYLELFARKQRAGWDVWGNEVENSINLEELECL